MYMYCTVHSRVLYTQSLFGIKDEREIDRWKRSATYVLYRVCTTFTDRSYEQLGIRICNISESKHGVFGLVCD